MSYQVNERIEIGIMINGIEFPFSKANALDSFHMVESTRIGVPMFRMKLIDSVEYISLYNPIVDGSQIQVIINARDRGQTSWSFRVNSSRRNPTEGSASYDIDGYLDVPEWWIGSSADIIEDSSSAVLGKIAGECGLTYEGVQTADKQKWCQRNIRNHEFCRWVTERAYKSEESGLQMVLTSRKKLRLVDINEPTAKASATFSIGTVADNSIWCPIFQPRNMSGSNNYFSGYGSKLLVQDPSSDEYFREVDSVNLARQTNSPISLNTSLKNPNSDVRFSPIDCGNTHDKYHESLYANRRIANFFSVGCDVTCLVPTDVHALDYVRVISDQIETGSPIKLFTGGYFVSSKTIFVNGNDYYEKFELCRTTINMDDSSLLEDGGEE